MYKIIATHTTLEEVNRVVPQGEPYNAMPVVSVSESHVIVIARPTNSVPGNDALEESKLLVQEAAKPLNAEESRRQVGDCLENLGPNLMMYGHLIGMVLLVLGGASFAALFPTLIICGITEASRQNQEDNLLNSLCTPVDNVLDKPFG